MRARRWGIAVAGAAAAAALALGAVAPASATDTNAPTKGFVQGLDVSNYQSTADLATAAADGAAFAFVKAGDADSLNAPAYTPSASFAAQWQAAGDAGLIRGAYVVIGMGNGKKAASAKREADDFVAGVGAAIRDPWVLPPVIDLEAGATTQCWMRSDASWERHPKTDRKMMVAWLHTLSNRIKTLTGRAPLIYTNRSWWDFCTGGSKAFAANGLFLAAYHSTPTTKPKLPSGWSTYRFWQWRATAKSADGFPGDQDVFHGSRTSLERLAETPLPLTHAAKVHGTRRVGHVLTATTGVWTSGARLRYQWYAAGKKIKGATSATLTLRRAQRGHRVKVRITASLTGYATTSRTSPVTIKVRR